MILLVRVSIRYQLKIEREWEYGIERPYLGIDKACVNRPAA